VVLACVLATQDRRCRVFVVTAVAAGLVFTAVTSALAWQGLGLRLTPMLEYGARYSTVPILLLDAALIVAADTYARVVAAPQGHRRGRRAGSGPGSQLGHRLPLPGPPLRRPWPSLVTHGRQVAWPLPAPPGGDDQDHLAYLVGGRSGCPPSSAAPACAAEPRYRPPLPGQALMWLGDDRVPHLAARSGPGLAHPVSSQPSAPGVPGRPWVPRLARLPASGDQFLRSLL
jgi:hypothetical protein